jgi:hypothetical protein
MPIKRGHVRRPSCREFDFLNQAAVELQSIIGGPNGSGVVNADVPGGAVVLTSSFHPAIQVGRRFLVQG